MSQTSLDGVPITAQTSARGAAAENPSDDAQFVFNPGNSVAPDLAELREAARNSPLTEAEMRSIAFSLILDSLSKGLLGSEAQVSKAVIQVAKNAGITELDAYKFLLKVHQLINERAWGK